MEQHDLPQIREWIGRERPLLNARVRRVKRLREKRHDLTPSDLEELDACSRSSSEDAQSQLEALARLTQLSQEAKEVMNSLDKFIRLHRYLLIITEDALLIDARGRGSIEPSEPDLPDVYKMLGVTPDHSAADIRRAIRKKKAELHPDCNRDDPDAVAKFAEFDDLCQDTVERDLAERES